MSYSRATVAPGADCRMMNASIPTRYAFPLGHLEPRRRRGTSPTELQSREQKSAMIADHAFRLRDISSAIVRSLALLGMTAFFFRTSS